ncbi:PWWP domain-containing protein 3-like isoform X3 [Penaeus chinensis]|uniref:PWWP domain-containing protein 3-like isoform X3 n=1 Tax=Penaeus chinensis TaxID=139456 RepID=UPI001FB63E46|nr:PWWP domain-containing protein 3-like isoform X3 [Penaeus chinensis]
MAMSSKKITYTSDFKLKVLDYYFKNGGDDNFGLKKKTAQHFNIDKKTISRMLNNPDMVKRARKLLARKVTTTPKNTPNTRQGAAKTSAKATKVAAAKVSVANTSGKVSASSHTSASNNNSNNSSSSYKASTSSASSTKHAGGSSGSNQGNSSSQPSAKSAASKNKCGDQEGDNGIQVFDLPEDPDYSILKKSINASANGVANLAKLLVTGTKEVQNLILNECDVILECKVCNNLFRSVVNFLAHKRIYCQEEYADVRSLFHKDNVQGITSHSRTVVVEPEPPPDTPQHLQPDPSTSASNTLTVPVRSGAQRSERRSGIDSIARRLANKRKQHSLSSSTYTGSSDYYQRISEINNKRDKLSRDCSVVLEDIGGVANAMYQTYVPPSKPSPVSTIRNLIDEVSEHEKGLTVAINENGDIMKTAAGNVTNMEVEQTPSNADVSKEIICRLCNTRFATQKTLSVHQRTQHGYERNIYCCPICQTTFLNILSVVKHLQKVHKKTKTQIERLRKVIKKNMYKKMVYQRDEFKDQEDLDRSNDKAELEKEEEEEEGEEEEEEEEEEQEQDQNQAEEEEREVAEGEENATCEQPAKMEVDSNPQKGNSANTTPKNSPVKSTLKMRPDIPPESPLNPRLRSETPEKKIAIQIRKDYKKTMAQSGSGAAGWGDEDKSQSAPFRVPHVPKELQFLKDPQSPKETQNAKETPPSKDSRDSKGQQEEPLQTTAESQEQKEPQADTETLEKKEPESTTGATNQSKIENLLAQFCNMSHLSCIPCEKRYQSITTLKRHASQHFDWTRFACKVCKYRSYHRYEAMRHCITEHQANEDHVAKMIKEDEYIGPLKYYITPTTVPRTQSPSGLSAPEVSEKSNDNASSFDTRHSKENNDQLVKSEKEDDQVPNKPEKNDTECTGEERTEKLVKVKEETEVEQSLKVNESKSDSMSDQAKVSLESATPLLESSLLKPSRTELKEKDIKDSVKNQESTKDLDVEESLPTREEVKGKFEGKEEVQNAVKVMKINKANTLALKQYPLRDQKESSQSTALVSSDSEEGRSERPQRTRRSVEQKDFIYDVKRSNSVKSENEKSDSKKAIVQKQTQECGEDQRSRSRKRSLSSRFEVVSKRGRVSEDSPPEPCNGSASQLAILDIEVPIHHTVSLRNGKNDAEPKLTVQGSPLAKRSRSTDNGPTRSTDSQSPESESPTSVDGTETPVNSDVKEESDGDEEHLAKVSSFRTSSEKRTVEKRRETEVGVRTKEEPFSKSVEEEAKPAKSKVVSGSEENSKDDHPTEATLLSRRDKSGSSAAKEKVSDKCEASSKSLDDKDVSQTPLDTIPLPNNDSSENQVQDKNNSSYSLENGDCEPIEKRVEKKGASMLNDTSRSDTDSCHPSQKEVERKWDKKRDDEQKKQKQKEILDSMRAVYNKPRDDIQD